MRDAYKLIYAILILSLLIMPQIHFHYVFSLQNRADEKYAPEPSENLVFNIVGKRSVAAKFSGNIIYVNGSGWWFEGGQFNPSSTPIQSAINNASIGDTIIVKDGVYVENIVVNKALTLISENGPEKTTITPSQTGYNVPVVNISASNVKISGFTITGGYHGIYLNYSNNNTIANNIITNNTYGVRLWHSNNNTITNNNITDIKQAGIDLYASSYNTIINNVIKNCTYNGIYLDQSSKNAIKNNGIENNKWGIYLFDHSINNTLMSNNITNNDEYGIWLRGSDNNTIINNIIANNTKYGIYIYRSSNCIIYLNNFDNTNNSYVYDSTNVWSSTEPLKYAYYGYQYSGYLGNYWSDYTGPDEDWNGVGDEPYILDENNTDNYPLVQSKENYLMVTETVPPTIETNIVEGSFLRDTVIIVVNASDASGIHRVELVINGTPICSDYDAPYEFEWYTPIYEDGLYCLELVAVDIFGNMANKTVIVMVDNTGPTIGNPVLSPEKPVEGEDVNVSVAVSDELSGVKNVTLWYSVAGGSWIQLQMSFEDGKWVATIPGQEADVEVTYYFKAYDKAGNLAYSMYYSYRVEEKQKEPTISSKLMAGVFVLIVGVAAGLLIALKKMKTKKTSKVT